MRPVVEGGPYDYYWKKVARGKQKMSQEVHISQDDSSVERCKDVDMVALEAVVNALEARTFKLETIIQVNVLPFPIFYQDIFF